MHGQYPSGNSSHKGMKELPHTMLGFWSVNSIPAQIPHHFHTKPLYSDSTWEGEGTSPQCMKISHCTNSCLLHIGVRYWCCSPSTVSEVNGSWGRSALHRIGSLISLLTQSMSSPKLRIHSGKSPYQLLSVQFSIKSSFIFEKFNWS